ncbi:YncE family protein [Pseudomonadota bacterium AL_CKDN230030165-1A_HGKHYDSX7]
MYVDIARGLVFFDGKDILARQAGLAGLSQYDPATGALTLVAGAQPDDVIDHVSRDERRMALRSSDWITVRNARRSRISVVADGALLQQTDKYLSFWTRLDPGGRFALASVFNGKGKPVVIDLETGEHSAPLSRDADARFGDIDPIGGRLWAPDDRAKDAVLRIDCATGEVQKQVFKAGDKIKRLRFSRDGAFVYVGCANQHLLCFDRDGVQVWSANLGEIGAFHATEIYFNESGSHLCVSLGATPRSSWGEDLVLSAATGVVDCAIERHRGPPARLASDWFGDQVLTHTGEILDFYTGALRGRLPFLPPPEPA